MISFVAFAETNSLEPVTNASGNLNSKTFDLHIDVSIEDPTIRIDKHAQVLKRATRRWGLQKLLRLRLLVPLNPPSKMS